MKKHSDPELRNGENDIAARCMKCTGSNSLLSLKFLSLLFYNSRSANYDVFGYF